MSKKGNVFVIRLDVQLFSSRQHMFCGIPVDFCYDRVNGE